MDKPNSPYDFFVSYAHEDNQDGWITQFIEALREECQKVSPGGSLNYFFDTESIRNGRDWEITLHNGIAHSNLFIAFLSPSYLAREWCRKEWQAWLQREKTLHIFNQGIQPVYLAPVQGLFDQKPEQIAAHVAEHAKLDKLDRTFTKSLEAVVKNLRQRQIKVDFTNAFPQKDLGLLGQEKTRRILRELAQEIFDQTRFIQIADQSDSNVPPYNPNFTGRTEELHRLRKWLTTDDRFGVIYGINGLGGIGKSELAFAYSHGFASNYPGGRFYIRCENKSSLREALLTDTSFMSFFDSAIPEVQKRSPETHFAALLIEFRKRINSLGPVLFLLDNVSDQSILSHQETKELTAVGPQLHLLATTRQPPPGSERKHWLSLDCLPESDCLELLEKFKPFSTETEYIAASSIVRRLGGFTLAVELIASFIEVHNKSYEQVVEEIDLTQLAEIAEDEDISVRHHEKRLDVILRPVLMELSPVQRRAMEYVALLPPDAIALPWLKTLVSHDFPELQQANGLNDPWNKLIHSLQKACLLNTDTSLEEVHRLARAHRLIQEFTLRLVNPEERIARQDGVSKFASERIKQVLRSANWLEHRWELLPLVELAQLWSDASHKDASHMMNEVGQLAHRLAEWNTAEPLMRQALEIDRNSYGENHPEVATDLSNLASLLKATNRLKEAEPLMRQALEIDRNSYGENHPNVATDLSNLASLLQDTNRLKEAEPLMRQALEIDRSSYGENHPYVAIRLNNLAQLLQDTNRLKEAEPLMRQALEIDRSSYGENHPYVAIRLNNLAQLLQDTNRLKEAEPLMRQALEIDRSSYGENHPYVAIGLNNLAQLLQDTNRLKEAEPLMRQALEIDRNSYGENHPEVATDLSNLASLLKATNRLKEAEPLMRQALEIDRNSYGENHPEVATDLNNLAQLLKATNRLEEAEPLMRQALEIDRNSYGENHPKVAIRLNNLAQLLKATNRLKEAEPLMRQALEIDRNSYGENHPNVAIRLNNLAQLLKATNRLKEAEPLMRQALEIVINSSRADQYKHPFLDLVTNSYYAILTEMGLTQEDISRKYLEIDPDFFTLLNGS